LLASIDRPLRSDVDDERDVNEGSWFSILGTALCNCLLCIFTRRIFRPSIWIDNWMKINNPMKAVCEFSSRIICCASEGVAVVHDVLVSSWKISRNCSSIFNISSEKCKCRKQFAIKISWIFFFAFFRSANLCIIRQPKYVILRTFKTNLIHILGVSGKRRRRFPTQFCKQCACHTMWMILVTKTSSLFTVENSS
jgi:hypothetical protein